MLPRRRPSPDFDDVHDELMRLERLQRDSLTDDLDNLALGGESFDLYPA